MQQPNHTWIIYIQLQVLDAAACASPWAPLSPSAVAACGGSRASNTQVWRIGWLEWTCPAELKYVIVTDDRAWIVCATPSPTPVPSPLAQPLPSQSSAATPSCSPRPRGDSSQGPTPGERGASGDGQHALQQARAGAAPGHLPSVMAVLVVPLALCQWLLCSLAA
jgi:hypothetical protein